jgi:adenylate cyclase
MIPGFPRCKICYAPFRGWGSTMVRVLYGKRPSNLNPKLCNVCEEFAKKYQGGAEIELTLLFVDVRGSTSLAERMRPKDFSALINRFYTTATRIMVDSDALIDKVIGDQAAGMYVPGIAGPEHARKAVEAAHKIMTETGHGESGEPWIPLGIGVHTGIAFVGSVGLPGSTNDITVLGDAANTAARLSSSAKVGEILVSKNTFASAGIHIQGLEERELTLKGKDKSIAVCVLKDAGV